MSTLIPPRRRPAVSTGSPRRPRGAAVTVLPGVAVAVALTAWHYSSKPMWRDEWITWTTTTRPLGGMADLLARQDAGLWPFYAVMHAWMTLDHSVTWMRLPAAVCTVLAVAATALVGRRVGGPWSAPWPG